MFEWNQTKSPCKVLDPLMNSWEDMGGIKNHWTNPLCLFQLQLWGANQARTWKCHLVKQCLQPAYCQLPQWQVVWHLKSKLWGKFSGWRSFKLSREPPKDWTRAHGYWLYSKSSKEKFWKDQLAKWCSIWSGYYTFTQHHNTTVFTWKKRRWFQIKMEEIRIYLDWPIAPSLYAANQSANTSDIFDFLVHRENKSLVPTAMPEKKKIAELRWHPLKLLWSQNTSDHLLHQNI